MYIVLIIIETETPKRRENKWTGVWKKKIYVVLGPTIRNEQSGLKSLKCPVLNEVAELQNGGWKMFLIFI